MRTGLIALGLMMATLAAGCDRDDAAHTSTPPPATSPALAPDNSTVSINGNEIRAPKGSTIVYESTSDRVAKGTGAGISTDNAEAAADFNAGAPDTGLIGEGNATGGSLKSSFRMKLPSGTSPLLWVGVAGIVGAGLCFYLGLRRAAIVCALIGVGFIGASALPNVALFILCAVGAIVLGFYIWAEHTGRGFHEALRAVVAGVETIPDDNIRRNVKTLVASHADERDTSIIKKVKARDGLKSER